MRFSAVLVDDIDSDRMLLREALLAANDIDIVGEGHGGFDAIALVAKTSPDFLVLDAGLPELNGHSVLQQVTETHPRTRVMMVSSSGFLPFVSMALRLGAWGYVLKADVRRHLVPALRRAWAGSRFLGPTLIDHALADAGLHSRAGGPDCLDGLTTQQRKVAVLISLRLTSPEIAKILGIDSRTVDLHCAKILDTTSLDNRTDLAHAVRCRDLTSLAHSGPPKRPINAVLAARTVNALSA